MRGNSFGEVLTIMTAGESHCVAMSGIIDGVPLGTPVTHEIVQSALDRRKPGQNEFTTPRVEYDLVQILSGVSNGMAMNTPIAIIIPNTNTRSEDYDKISNSYRPGHADASYDLKFGIRDSNGGGRSSFRVFAPVVALGAIAKQIVADTEITAFVDQIGSIKANIDGTPTLTEIEASPIRCPDLEASTKMQELITEVAKDGDSIGGSIKFIIDNVVSGLGEPMFGKLNARVTAAMAMINAVTAVEIGDGFKTAEMRGSEYNDEILRKEHHSLVNKTNHAGGIQGGISTGMSIFGRVAFHPTSSIAKPQQTIDTDGHPVTISVDGRHDPCVLPRAVPAVEAMIALVIADFTLLRRLDLLIQS